MIDIVQVSATQLCFFDDDSICKKKAVPTFCNTNVDRAVERIQWPRGKRER